MKQMLLLVAGLSAGAAALTAQSGDRVVSTGSLLAEMADLERLARWPEPGFRLVQFSSYDRRSTTPEAPGWFSNADGFGREPIPGFMKVLREPGENQKGDFLVAEVNGPGAIVRGWSAGMGGVLRVHLDGAEVWSGPAYEFFARRSAHYLKQAGMELETDDAFVQEDADYLPMPFARSLRVTWEGTLRELHFYHLQVRIYPEGTRVRGFEGATTLKQVEKELRAAVTGLTSPGERLEGEVHDFSAGLVPGTNWVWSADGKGAGAVRELRLWLEADDREAALRQCVLRVSFDGSQRPQVEAPVGDFFGSGPGVNPYGSLPMSVEADGTMVCRFVMPFEKSARVEVANHSAGPVRLRGQVRVSGWNWDERSMYFRAKWRADHDLVGRPATMDLPYVITVGKGVFAGCAAMIMNPSGVPTAGGNWWGEGDEKFLVDGEDIPSTFGTGSEDYFNYSWSRSGLFDHPYCGQPLDSGPDTAGHVSNHRFQVIDAIPFERSLAALMELWTHRPTPGMSYARTAYHYARPGAVDDHRGLMPADLKVPALPRREPVMAGGASGGRFYLPAELKAKSDNGNPTMEPHRLATQLEVLGWEPQEGDKLRLQLPVEKPGRWALHLVAVHQPGGAKLRASVNGETLETADGSKVFALRSEHQPRVLNVNFKPVELKNGTQELLLECMEPGKVMLDYVWVKGS